MRLSPHQLLSAAVDGLTENKALPSVMVRHLSLHPHAFISLPTCVTSPTCSPLVFPLLSFPLSPFLFSPQIIANHHMQSISFASGGDPVSHSTLSISLSLSPSYSGFTHFLFLPDSLFPFSLGGSVNPNLAPRHQFSSCISFLSSVIVCSF